jgi:hypothetical protein
MQPYRLGLPTARLKLSYQFLVQLLSIPFPDVVAPSFPVWQLVVNHSLVSSKSVEKFERFDEVRLELLLE